MHLLALLFFFLQTEMTDSPILSYTSTSEIPTLSYTRSLKKIPLSAGLLIGHGKKVKFCRIFRGKFVEKSADFAGILWEISGQTLPKSNQ